MLLKSRSAYIGLFIIIAINILCYYTEFDKKRLLLSLGILSTLTFILIAGLAQTKKASSEGRILIWKLSAQMALEKPLGCGYGLFEKNYNIYQSTYFSKGCSNSTEKENADHVFMPYNDTLEHAIEGGGIGACFYLLIYIYVIRMYILSLNKGRSSYGKQLMFKN